MKQTLLFALLAVVFFSCEDDVIENPNGGETTTPTETNYYPDTVGNQWIYEWARTTGDNQTNGTDTTKIDGMQTFDGKEYKKWFPTVNTGISDTVYIRKEGKMTYFKPSPLELSGDSVRLELPEFPVLDTDNTKTAPRALTADTLVIKKTMDAIQLPDSAQFKGTATPDVELKIVSTHTQTHAKAVLNGSTEYTDVYQTDILYKLKLDVNVSGTFNGLLPIQLTQPLVPEQEFGKITIWFAKDIGVVRSEYVYDVKNVNTKATLPGVGEIDLASYGFDIKQVISKTKINGVAELKEYTLK